MSVTSQEMVTNQQIQKAKILLSTIRPVIRKFQTTGPGVNMPDRGRKSVSQWGRSFGSANKNPRAAVGRSTKFGCIWRLPSDAIRRLQARHRTHKEDLTIDTTKNIPRLWSFFDWNKPTTSALIRGRQSRANMTTLTSARSIIFILCLSGSCLASRKLLVFLIDGFRYDYIDDLESLPGFKEIVENGVKVDYMTPNFPSLSYPNFYSLMTGESYTCYI